MSHAPSGSPLDRTESATRTPSACAVSTAGTSAWEHYLLRSRAQTGLVFEGLKVGTARGPGWDVVATDATWRQGGIVAIWDAPENCGGSCDPTKSSIKLVISVVPKPQP